MTWIHHQIDDLGDMWLIKIHTESEVKYFEIWLYDSGPANWITSCFLLSESHTNCVLHCCSLHTSPIVIVTSNSIVFSPIVIIKTLSSDVEIVYMNSLSSFHYKLYINKNNTNSRVKHNKVKNTAIPNLNMLTIWIAMVKIRKPLLLLILLLFPVKLSYQTTRWVQYWLRCLPLYSLRSNCWSFLHSTISFCFHSFLQILLLAGFESIRCTHWQ